MSKYKAKWDYAIKSNLRLEVEVVGALRWSSEEAKGSGLSAPLAGCLVGDSWPPPLMQNVNFSITLGLFCMELGGGRYVGSEGLSMC